MSYADTEALHHYINVLLLLLLVSWLTATVNYRSSLHKHATAAAAGIMAYCYC